MPYKPHRGVDLPGIHVRERCAGRDHGAVFGRADRQHMLSPRVGLLEDCSDTERKAQCTALAGLHGNVHRGGHEGLGYAAFIAVPLRHGAHRSVAGKAQPRLLLPPSRQPVEKQAVAVAPELKTEPPIGRMVYIIISICQHRLE